MICRKVSSLVKPALLILFAALLCLSASQTTAAKPFAKTTAKMSHIVVDSKNFTNAKEFKRYLLRIIGSKGKKAKSEVRVSLCTCAPQELESIGSCFKNCLTDMGVNPMSAAACAATCSVNLVGCTICVGVGEWVVLGCAQYCVWRNTWLLEARQSYPAQNRGLQQAKLSMKRSPVIVKG